VSEEQRRIVSGFPQVCSRSTRVGQRVWTEESLDFAASARGESSRSCPVARLNGPPAACRSCATGESAANVLNHAAGLTITHVHP
jgi:hypothetical protein